MDIVSQVDGAEYFQAESESWALTGASPIHEAYALAIAILEMQPPVIDLFLH